MKIWKLELDFAHTVYKEIAIHALLLLNCSAKNIKFEFANVSKKHNEFKQKYKHIVNQKLKLSKIKNKQFILINQNI